MNDIVSIITPMYNSKKYVKKAIKSVQDQTYIYWEMFIIDDHSIDDSIDIVRALIKNDKRINLIMLPKHSGPAIARNKGIELANGRYIAFLDSDDMWHHEKLEKQIKFMATNNYVFSFTSFQRIDRNNNYSSL